jgi:predicted deacetylase
VRKAVEPVEDQVVLLSLHDITPANEDDVVRTYDLLAGLGISSITLLITPFHGLKKSNCFRLGSFFSEFLLSLNLEISLHGYSHFSKSGSPHEFANLTTERAVSRLRDGIALVRQGFGRRPIGFVPPMWDSPPRIVKAVKQVGLEYCVIKDQVHLLGRSKVFGTGARIISQGQRFLNTESAMFEIELGGALQIGVHPSDYKANGLIQLLEDLKDRQQYRFYGYHDYLEYAKRKSA